MNIKCIYLRDKLKKYIKNSINCCIFRKKKRQPKFAWTNYSWVSLGWIEKSKAIIYHTLNISLYKLSLTQLYV